MIMYLEDTEEKPDTKAEKKSALTVRRKVQTEGVYLFNNFYFHPALANFRGAEVEVRYVPGDLQSVGVTLPDTRDVIAGLMPVISDDVFIEDAFELIETKRDLAKSNAVNRVLVAALYSALELRGIFSGLSDPLALVNEKANARDRYREIEAQIRAAIKQAEGK